MSKLVTLADLTGATTTAGTNVAAVPVGIWRRAQLVLNVTSSGVDAGDTLDVYVDVSPDGGVSWLNAVHFAQQAGTGAAKKELATLDPAAPGTSTIAATSDCAAGAVRPAAFGTQMRVRYVIVNGAGGGTPAHNFSVKALIA